MRRDSFIYPIRKSLEPEFCQEIIQRFEVDSRKYPGRVGSGSVHRPELRQATDLCISKLADWTDVDAKLYAALARGVQAYQKRYPILGTFRLRDRGYMIQRTLPGEKYDWHSDVATPDTAPRQFIGLWYLNTVEAGGETEFLEQKIRIKPEQGCLLLFPAFWTHVHRGCPPISGTKYTAISWLSFAD
jgi:hypothetical protein